MLSCVNKCRAIARKTARCRCEFRYVGYIEFYNGIVRFLCRNTASLYRPIISDRSNAEITHRTLILTAVT